MRAHRVIGDRRVALGAPVAGRVTRAGTDDQRRLRIGNQRCRVLLRVLRQRQIPFQRDRLDAERARESPGSCRARAAGCAARCCALVNSHCSSRARARSKPSRIVARRSAATARLARSDSCMCSSTSKRRPRSARAQAARRRQPGALVDGDKLDAGQQTHQPCLSAADDPGQLRRRPDALQRAHEGHDMAGIADGREPQNAQALGSL